MPHRATGSSGRTRTLRSTAGDVLARLRLTAFAAGTGRCAPLPTGRATGTPFGGERGSARSSTDRLSTAAERFVVAAALLLVSVACLCVSAACLCAAASGLARAGVETFGGSAFTGGRTAGRTGAFALTDGLSLDPLAGPCRGASPWRALPCASTRPRRPRAGSGFPAASLVTVARLLAAFPPPPSAVFLDPVARPSFARTPLVCAALSIVPRRRPAVAGVAPRLSCRPLEAAVLRPAPSFAAGRADGDGARSVRGRDDVDWATRTRAPVTGRAERQV